MRVIGITGKAGAGKDTIAAYLYRKYDYEIMHFADPLKRACAAAFGIDLIDFYNSEAKEIPNRYWGKSPREIAQFVGTEMFRNLWGETFWTRRAELVIQEARASQNTPPGISIADVRFDTEAEMIVDYGGIIIEVVRPGLTEAGIPGHSSEAGITRDKFSGRLYLVNNNATIEELCDSVDFILDLF